MLNQEQSNAAKKVEEWMKSPTSKWMFKLAGYAGTGKTFLLAKIINNIKGQFWCCAPTGKAASVLSSKLDGVQVMTVHQLMYQPKQQSISQLTEMIAKAKAEPSKEAQERIDEEKAKLSNSKPGFHIKDDSLLKHGDIVIVDESSMVTTKMRDDFERHGAKVLFVGDEGQLPPIGSNPWFIEYPADARLVEVQRQAAESPIIRLSMDIRNGSVDPKQYQMDDCKLTSKGNVDPKEWLKFDQILVGMNKTRQKVNRFFRKQLGYKGQLPMAGEKLICLKNDLKGDVPFINGVIFNSISDSESSEDFSIASAMDIRYEGRDIIEQMFYTYHCARHYDFNLVEEPREFRNGLLELDYAYAITVHKSQGSEWDSVLLADDGFQRSDAEFRKRWLYTAVTRAKNKLLLVQ